MGYTNYYTFKNVKPASATKAKKNVSLFVDWVVKKNDINIVDGSGLRGTLPKLALDGNGSISFNGAGDDSHETFAIDDKPMGFNFTKTNGKPYDPVVFASLIILKECLGDSVDIGSDGIGTDYMDDEIIEAIKLYVAYLVDTGQVKNHMSKCKKLFINVITWCGCIDEPYFVNAIEIMDNADFC